MERPMINTQLDRNPQAYWRTLETLTGREHQRSPTMSQNHSFNTVYEEEELEEEREEECQEEFIHEIDDLYNDIDDRSDTSSLPSIEGDTVNFDLVHALHKFDATDDGQVAVEKNDPLVLLDDSNAYWWLVKVKKNSDIGYIPAEHIELPNERLARLNKKKNVARTEFVHDDLPSNSSSKKNVIFGDLCFQAQTILVSSEDDYSLEDDDEEYQVEYEVWNEEIDEMDEGSMIYYEDDEEDEGHVLSYNEHNGSTPATTPSSMSAIFEDRKWISHALRRWVSRSKRNETSLKTKIVDDASSEITSSASLTSTSTMSEFDDMTSHMKPGYRLPSVLRVYGGSINAGATFKTVQVEEGISAQQLLERALVRFKIEADSKAIEYYLAVKVEGEDEVKLAPEKRLDISLLKQADGLGDGCAVRFFLHKQIKRLVESSGKMRVKISYYGEAETVPSEGNEQSERTTLSGRSFRRQKSQAAACREHDRIDKLVEVPASITIKDLTYKALEKFNITQRGVIDKQPLSHGIFISVNGQEKKLDVSQFLANESLDGAQLILRRVHWDVPRSPLQPRPRTSSHQTPPPRTSSDKSRLARDPPPPLVPSLLSVEDSSASHSINVQKGVERRESLPSKPEKPVQYVDRLLQSIEPLPQTPCTPNSQYYRISRSILPKPKLSWSDDVEIELDQAFAKLNAI